MGESTEYPDLAVDVYNLMDTNPDGILTREEVFGFIDGITNSSDDEKEENEVEVEESE